MIRTRFAPSPTGMLHIGGARTALFNWLFARHHQGKFILRIDDTDRERSTAGAVEAILGGMGWLGLDWDEGPIFQHKSITRHAAIAQELLAAGQAYRCYCTPEELEAQRKAAIARKKPPRYEGTWRDRPLSDAPTGADYVIRLKAPQSGQTVINDLILGEVKFSNSELDDFILLRADGSPTYMLSTVVDDHDLGITHVIRGNEHLNNAARQIQIFNAMGWEVPRYGHIPLIHGMDGQKLSKRHGAVGVESYRDDGFLPVAMLDYLSRLGWTHGIEEYLPMSERIARFDLTNMGRGPARFDLAKLNDVNFHYMKMTADAELVARLLPFLAQQLGRDVTPSEQTLLTRAMPGLKQRNKNLQQLAENSAFYCQSVPLPMTAAAAALLTPEAKARLAAIAAKFTALADADWTHDGLDALIKSEATAMGIGFAQLAQPLRAALSGLTSTPSIGDVMAVLGREESLRRMAAAAA
ncbi:MAG: glutamate--tRNA ligase [Candidatus Symbiobacter sp.]|nr:glutamate--tRNA ligase [Candidatus Symbiobacter sp.]